MAERSRSSSLTRSAAPTSLAVSVEAEIKGGESVQRGLRLLPAAIDEAKIAAMDESLDMARTNIRFRTPMRSGKLMSAWDTRQDIPGSLGVIFNSTKYARPVEGGARPHEIRPRFKRALFWPGAGHPVKVVHHPGMIGRHMGREGMKASIPGIVATFAKHLRRSMSAVFNLR